MAPKFKQLEWHPTTIAGEHLRDTADSLTIAQDGPIVIARLSGDTCSLPRPHRGNEWRKLLNVKQRGRSSVVEHEHMKDILTKLVLEGLSTREIGARVGLSQTTVRYWLSKYGLETVGSVRLRKKLVPTCIKCGRSDVDFYKRSNGKNQSTCISCLNAGVMEKGRDNKKWAVLLKGGRCEICGYSRSLRALQFHHLDSSSKDPLFVNFRYWGRDRILKEIKGCRLLCANCHAEIHDSIDDNSG